MDDGGIPIAIEAFPGNTLDHLTLRPALKKTIDGLDFSRFILIADRGICNYMNLLSNFTKLIKQAKTAYP